MKKTAIPTIIAFLLACLINAFPLIMASFDEDWAQAGWAFYFFTVPAGLFIILVGLFITITWLVIRWLRKRKTIN